MPKGTKGFPKGYRKGVRPTWGRQKGTPNKTTTFIKEATLMAAEIAGSKDLPNKDKLPGMVNYLRVAALREMPSFMALLAKILPTQLVNKNGDDVTFTHIERVIIHADGTDYRFINGAGQKAIEVSDAERLPASTETR